MPQSIESTYVHAHAIHIEGVGPLNGITNPTDRLGYLWTTDATFDGDTDGTVKFQPVDQSNAGAATIHGEELIDESLSGIGHSINVFKAQITWGAFDFEVRGNQFNVELLRFSQRNPAFELTSSVKKSDTSIDTTATGGSLAGSVGFIRDETIYFESHSGSGTYSVKRGYYLSSPQYHASSTNIYTDVPFWKNRRVRFFTYAITEPGDITLERRYIGLVDGSLEHDHNRIVVPTTSYGAQLRDARCNQDTFSRRQLASNGSGINADKIQDGSDNQDPIYTPSGNLIFDSDGGESKLIKQSEYTDASDLTTWIQFNKLIAPYNGSRIENLLRELESVGFSGSELTDIPILPFQQSLEGDAPKEIDEIWEPFVVSKTFDEKVTPEFGPFSATRFLSQGGFPVYYRYHPVAIVASLLMSSYSETLDTQNFDILHGNWGIGAYSMLVDSFPSDAKTLIENNPQDQVDYFVLGQQGSEVQLWEQLTQLLRTWGYYWTVKKNGRISINKIRNTEVDFWSDGQSNPIQPVQSSTLMVSNGTEGVVDTVEAQVGNIDNIQDPVRVQVQIQENKPNRNVTLSRRADRTIEMDSIHVSNVGIAEKNIHNLAFLQTFARPKFQMQVRDYLDIDSSFDRDYSLGAPVSLKDIPLAKKWISRQGKQQRISDNDLNFAGRIVRRTFLPQKRAYEMTVEIIGTGSLARWRSPSGVVKSVDSTSPISVDLEDNTNANEILRGAEPFHVGDEVQFFNPEGVKRSTKVFEIDSINGNTLELTNGPFNVDPSPGDICELAFLDIDESGTGFLNKGILANIDRPYVGLADTDSTLGDPDVDTDIYGAR